MNGQNGGLRNTGIAPERWGPPDIVADMLPSGIMSLVLASSRESGEMVWSEIERCVADNSSFLGRYAVRRGPVAKLDQLHGETLKIMPSGFWTGTLAVQVNAMSIGSSSELRACLERLSVSLQDLSRQHWHANPPGFSIWACDLFDCGREGIGELAANLFGQLANGTLYIDESEDKTSGRGRLTLTSPNAVADCRVDEGRIWPA